ncbi:MAG: prepilin-type N-terminal cleavage/methylation domain-containing protein [Bacillota bacterium]|jgi:type IV pilus assembly protein PilA
MFDLQKIMKNKKGFTLVEIIVVLVIIAVLAAIAIPALTGYIDRSKERAAISEARTVLVAAQTLASDSYAKGGDETAMAAAVTVTEVNSLTGLSLEESSISSVAVNAEGKVTDFVVTTTNGKVVTYDHDSTTDVFTINSDT